MNILFVCTANISRSYLAEMLLRHHMAQHHLTGVDVASAGLHAQPGHPPDPQMVRYLLNLGVPQQNHEATLLTGEAVERADLVLVMEKAHFHAIKRRWPETEGKLALLGAYLPGGRRPDDIMDPYGHSSFHYRTAQSQITLAVKGLMASLFPGGTDT